MCVDLFLICAIKYLSIFLIASSQSKQRTFLESTRNIFKDNILLIRGLIYFFYFCLLILAFLFAFLFLFSILIYGLFFMSFLEVSKEFIFDIITSLPTLFVISFLSPLSYSFLFISQFDCLYERRRGTKLMLHVAWHGDKGTNYGLFVHERRRQFLRSLSESTVSFRSNQSSL